MHATPFVCYSICCRPKFVNGNLSTFPPLHLRPQKQRTFRKALYRVQFTAIDHLFYILTAASQYTCRLRAVYQISLHKPAAFYLKITCQRNKILL